MSVTVPAVMVVFCRLRMAAAVTAELLGVDRDGAAGVGDGRGLLDGQRGAGLHRDGARIGDGLGLQRVGAGGDGERPGVGEAAAADDV